MGRRWWVMLGVVAIVVAVVARTALFSGSEPGAKAEIASYTTRLPVSAHSGAFAPLFASGVEAAQAGASRVRPAWHLSSAALARIKLTHLRAAAAARVDREVFPVQLDRRVGGPPTLPRGARIVRYVSPHAAQVTLPHGKRAVIESMQPMAVDGVHGHHVPVDLTLTKMGRVFESSRPLVSVLIPQAVRQGIALPEAGISLTPVNSDGVPLAGSKGVIDGASVVYANTQRDADTVVKPTLSGVEASTVLRSARSSTVLRYRIALPPGARLSQSPSGVGAVRIVQGQRTIAAVDPPGAIDATGSDVPVSMAAHGDLLVISVATPVGSQRLPVAVDPELALVRDEAFLAEQCHQIGEAERVSSNWCWHPSSAKFRPEWWTGTDPAVDMWNEGATSAGEYGVMSYLTQGESKIYEAGAYTDGYLTGGTAKFEFARERSVEVGEVEAGGEDVLQSGGYKAFGYNHFCANTKSEAAECPPAGGSPKNLVAVKAEASQALPETYDIDFGVQNPEVYISQEKAPEASVNETEDELEVEKGVKRVNVAYTKGWLSPEQGAFEYIVHDPGIGVSEAGIQEMGGGNIHIQEKISEAGKCNGVQCKETYRSAVTYSPEMADGEDKFEVWGRDEAGLFGYAGFYQGEGPVIKVDGTKPYGLGFTGMAEEGAEVSAAPHTLTVHATDGVEPTPSSGVKSIAISIDGGPETAVSGASCAEGPCTASGQYTLHAEDLTEGVHRLVETAVDNAGNVAPREFLFDVRHGTPLPIGPGAVDPVTGQLKLSATDVSLAGAGGVSRVYQSRDLTAGTGGPLGPQWTLSLGGGQGLTQLPDGSVVLASSAGGTTTFHLNEKGEYESPPGDEDVELQAKEAQVGKGISEYRLTDAKAGTTTVFAQPNGTEVTKPVYANQFGQEGADLGKPVSTAFDAHGNLWVTDYTNDRVLEFSKAGMLLRSFGTAGEWPNQFKEPWGIAVSKATGDVYVSDPGNSRIVELNASGAFVRAFGWGVKPGGERKDEFQDCTSYCDGGVAGTGAGQLDWPQGVAIDGSGDVWVAEYDSNRIQEFDAEGHFLHSYGSAGSGDGQFEGPLNLAFVGGDLYVTDRNNNRVQELTTSGAFVEAIGWGVSNGEEKLQVCTSGCRAGIAGPGNGELDAPWGLAVDPAGDLYVSDQYGNDVQELTIAGAFVTKFGSGGSGDGQLSEPMGIALGASGEIYVADYSNKRVQEWMRPSWLPSRTEGALKHVSTAYAYEAVPEEGKAVVEPTEALAATPAGITCVGEHGEVEPQYLKDGCRALSFNYASATTAKGEAPSEWGDYHGHLTRVYFHGYDTATKAMATRAVAHYLYDAKGRLRAEWDPRTESAPESEACSAEPLASGCLATVYGYDAEGHVTSVTPPHQESWALTYGTIAGDLDNGRLIKVARAPASQPVWHGEALVGTEAPVLSGTPMVGVRMSVSNGAWTGHPFAYGYQWEDCEAAQCSPIAGATNANYTPTAADAGKTLEAQVTAISGAGAVAATATSSPVSADVSVQTVAPFSAGLNAISCISGSSTCVVVDGQGNAHYSTNVVDSALPTWTSWPAQPRGPAHHAVDCASSAMCLMSDGLAASYPGWLHSAAVVGGPWRTGEFSSGVDAISCPSASFCVVGQDSQGDFGFSTAPTSSSWTFEKQGEAAMTSVACASLTFCVLADSDGDVHVATTTAQIESSGWTETDVDGTTALTGVACLSSSSCVAVDGAGNALTLTVSDAGAASVVRHDLAGTTALTGVACPDSTTCVAVDAGGEVFVSENVGESWSRLYSLGDDLTAVSCVSSSLCVATDTAGNAISFDLTGAIAKGEPRPPQPGSTIEYRVPISGEGAPQNQNLSKEEVAKWGQKDDPDEATAIFPADEPQSWPATGYRKATVDYMDEQGRTVNVLSPSGGIATTEYNEVNETTRTLSPQNRASALAEGCISLTTKECKSAEAAAKLDAETEYSPEDTQIVKVTGPEHKIMLASGEEVLARAVTHDFYDEGAEEAEEENEEEYNLLTRSVTAALLANGEEREKRTTLTGYSGQEDLGWMLRKPTSTTVDPKGLDLTSSTVYNKETGEVVETHAPGGNSAYVSPPSFALHFGSAGTGNGQFTEPQGVAVDSAGNVWTLDTGDDRVEKFSGSGGFDAAYGTVGTGDLQFAEPKGIAVNQSTGEVYVADTKNNRIDVLNASGEFVDTFGWGVSDAKAELEVCKTACAAGIAGAGDGQLNAPLGLTVDSHGDIWVADAGNDRIEVFAEDGSYLGQFGSKGSGNGQLLEPSGVAISEGSVYVVDHGNDRVEQFSTAGVYRDQFGSKGTEAGQFEEPYGIAVNRSTGVLYVCDTTNERMQEFSPAGKFLTQWLTWGASHGQYKPRGVAVSATGDLYIVDHAADVVGEWIPPEAGGAHLSFSTQFGSKGSGDGQLLEAGGVALDGKGNVWVSDYANDRIEEFSAQGAFLAAYGKEGSGEVQFKEPTRLAVNKSTGDVYVTDMLNNRVEELSSTGAYIRSFGTSGAGALNDPIGDAIDSSGDVWVADRGNNRIVEFSATGTYIATYGKEGTGELQFKAPDGIAFVGENLYVTDSANHRVEELTNKGAFVRTIGVEGGGSSEFDTPEGIAVDAAGNLYVSDLNKDHVEEFSPGRRVQGHIRQLRDGRRPVDASDRLSDRRGR